MALRKSTGLFLFALFALVLAARLCHLDILWAEETLPLAAAAQMAHGKALYRDMWFDKPPLLGWTYLVWGARDGLPLRLAGALYALLACCMAWRFAYDLWGRREALWAAGLLAFYLVFDIPSAVTPLAADLLMLAPHLAAVWLAWRGRAFWSGDAGRDRFPGECQGRVRAGGLRYLERARAAHAAGGICRSQRAGGSFAMEPGRARRL